MAGNIHIEATVDVFTGQPLVVVITSSDTTGVIATEANLSPDEAESLGRNLILVADVAREKASSLQENVQRDKMLPCDDCKTLDLDEHKTDCKRFPF